MIERVARCLEIGGHTALRGNKTGLRSRRHLHSAFWAHGAGNIDLPAWWIFLLQTPESAYEPSSNRRSGYLREAVSSELQDIFLDFLYPVQTLALIRQLKRSSNAHRLAAQNAKRYSRTYVSIAKDFISGANAVRAEAATPATGSDTRQAGDLLKKSISDLLDCKDHTGLYDELWQSYQDLLELPKSLSPQDLVRLLRCLVLSRRTIDVERAVALFEGIPVHQRRAIHYSHAVSAALTLKDLGTAITIHREALSRINGSIGTAAILCFAIQEELWKEAIDTWHGFWEHKLSYYAKPEIWAAVDALPLVELISKASSAADFAISISESTDEGMAATAAREFGLELIRRVLSIVGINFNVNAHWELVAKARTLAGSNDSSQKLALIQLLSVDTREHGHRALHLYRILRRSPDFLPTKDILNAVTYKLLEHKIDAGLLMILEDWRTHFTALPARLATRVARVLAQNGHPEATQNLLDEYISTYGKPKTDALYHSLLFAYNRRADTEGIVRLFDDLREMHGFEPGVKGWNSLISTFARVGDIDGALNYFQKLRDAGVRPDSATYFLLMSMYGKRGDRDAVDDLFAQSKAEGIPTTIKMIDTIVLAKINDGALKEAERLVEEALLLDLDGPRTFMWGVLLNAYALRKDIEKVSYLHKRMQEAGVPSDGMVYAALMTSLTVAKLPDAARKIMDTIMPRNKVKRTALHYAIVMGGYLRINQYGRVFQLYKNMLRDNMSPNMSTQNVLLRAAGSVDKAALSGDEDSTTQTELLRAEQTFEQTIANLDPRELAASEPRPFAGPQPLNEAFTSTYFDYLIFLYGTEGAFSKAIELYERYVTMSLPLQGTDRDIEISPPTRLLSAIMVTHLRTGNYSEVDRCWSLALEKSEQLACKSKADIFRPGWVLHSRRFIINLPLHQYITSLTDQNRTEDLIDTIDGLHSAGYALNSANWNIYIQALARSPQMVHHFLAFEHCERHLMAGWPGWASFGNPNWMKPKLRAVQRDMLLKQDQSAPAYLTLVFLARAYLECRSQGKSHLTLTMERSGPRTVDAINNMPRLDDRPQSEILRQSA
jgi:pentatricopeptide repeat-containing protein PET309